MTNIPDTHATDGVPTYLGSGDPAGRFADYYPAWMDKLAGDVTLEGSMFDGAVQGADAIRAVIGSVRELYDRQDFRSAKGRRHSCCSSTSAGTSTTGIPRWSTRWRATGEL